MSNKEFEREKLRTSEFKDIGIEKKFLASLLKYREVLRSSQRDFNSEAFSSDRNKWIYEQIIQFFDSYNEFLNTEGFQILLSNLPEIKRAPYLKMWKMIVKLKSQVKKSSAYAYKVKLMKLYQARTIELGLHKTADNLKKALNEGDSFIDIAKEEYLRIAPKLENKSVEVSIVDPFSMYERFKKEHIEIQQNPKLLQAVPTGIKQLDETMTGLMPSEFGLITAGTGVGKSIIMGDFAYHCFRHHGDVIYVSIEMSAKQLYERLFCRISKVLYEKFRRYQINKEDFARMDAKIEKLLKETNFKYRVIDLPSSASVMQIRNEIERTIEKEKINPKLILIDYMNILHGGFDWSQQLGIAVEIKQQIARWFKIGTWSANQLMGAKNETEHVKISTMAFAKNITDNVDIGIGIGQTEESKDNDIFNIDWTKTRGFKGKSFALQGDRSRMTFSSAKTSEGKEEEIKFKQKQSELGAQVKV